MLPGAQLQRAASEGGFPVESYEKVQILLQLLDTIRIHPFLGDRVALKGGTALNLFVLDLPRLSVDVDLNYLGPSSREDALSERPLVEEAIRQVCGRIGIAIKKAPSEHAGGKWRLSYRSAFGRPGTLELDVTFMLRTPLWPVLRRDSHRIGNVIVTRFPILDTHELAAGKLAALVARGASRDVFDTHSLLSQRGWLDPMKLRLGFVVYGGANRVDWRSITSDSIRVSAKDADAQLLPMLRSSVRPDRPQVADWTETLVRETRQLMSVVLPLTDREREFIDHLNDNGEIIPELLTDDPGMQSIIHEHPGLKWKALNVKEYVGRQDDPRRSA